MHDPQMDIVGGLISGVGSGIVIAIALGLWHLGRRHLRRRQQIGEVRESVRRQFKSMINPYVRVHVDQIEDVEGLMRYLDLRRLQRDLQVVIDHNSDSLTPAQRSDLKRHLIDLDHLFDVHGVAHERSVSLLIAKTTYSQFTQTEWLRLPEEL